MCSPCAVSRLWVALRLRNSKNACITNIYCDWNSRLDMHDLMSKILDCNPACTHLPCRNLPAGRVNNISWSWTIWLKKITSAFIAAIVLLSQLISPGIFFLLKKNVNSCRGCSQTPAKTHENCDLQVLFYKISFRTNLPLVLLLTFSCSQKKM